MKANHLVVISVVWTMLMAGLGILGARYIAHHPLDGAGVLERSQQLGRSLGVLIGIGYGFIWIPWAVKVRRERRAEEARLARKARRRKRR